MRRLVIAVHKARRRRLRLVERQLAAAEDQGSALRPGVRQKRSILPLWHAVIRTFPAVVAPLSNYSASGRSIASASNGNRRRKLKYLPPALLPEGLGDPTM
jgi:hypothetical protein